MSIGNAGANFTGHEHEGLLDVYNVGLKNRATWMAITLKEARANQDGPAVEGYLHTALYRDGEINAKKLMEQLGKKDVDCGVDLPASFGEGTPMQTAYDESYPTRDKDHLDVVCKTCPMVQAWKAYGYEGEDLAQLCKLTCRSEQGMAETLGLKFEAEQTIAAGADCCKLHYHR